MNQQNEETVKVMIRIRPINQIELDNKAKSIVIINKEEKSVSFDQKMKDAPQKLFIYNNVFDGQDSQEDVYKKSAYQIVENVLEGYNGTIFAYGQTGCGKTHTMMGDYKSNTHKGIIPRACSHLLTRIASDKNNFQCVSISCTYIELYNEQIYDLMEKKREKKSLKNDPNLGIFVQNVVQSKIEEFKNIMDVIEIGDANRSVGETAMNKGSSRSHCVFTINLEVINKKGDIETVKKSKLNFVDLAGSERQSKTHAQGDRLKEANNINLSLSALGNVIAALVSKRKVHIPYRDSKLTRILEDSLGGNTKTLMMVAISPADYNFNETLSSLLYASRAKQIKNVPKINEDPRDTLIKKYQVELLNLRKQMQINNIDIIVNQEGIQECQKIENQVVGIDLEEIEKKKLITQQKLQEEEKKRQNLEYNIKLLEEKLSTRKQMRNTIVIDENERLLLQKLERELQKEEEYEKAQQIPNRDKEQENLLQINKLNELKKLEQELLEVEKENQEILHKNLEDQNQFQDNLFQQEQELKFLQKFMKIIFSKQEQEQIEKRVKIDGDEINIPLFYLSQIKEDKPLPILNPLKQIQEPNKQCPKPLKQLQLVNIQKHMRTQSQNVKPEKLTRDHVLPSLSKLPKIKKQQIFINSLNIQQ